MKNLSRFKVDKDTLLYGEYSICILPLYSASGGYYLKFVVYYKDKEIFSSDEKDTLEDIIETIFELEKQDGEYKDRKSFQLCLNKILEMNKWKI